MEGSTVRSNELGASLFGVLVTIAIFLICTDFAVSKFSDFAERLKMKTECELLRTEIERASIEAQLFEKEIEIYLEQDSWIRTLGNSANNATIFHKIAYGITLVDLPSPAVLHFYPNLVAKPTHFTINGDHRRCTVTISLRSRITMVCQ